MEIAIVTSVPPNEDRCNPIPRQRPGQSIDEAIADLRHQLSVLARIRRELRELSPTRMDAR